MIHCTSDPAPGQSPEIAANEALARYIENFEGRGDQADDTQPTPPEEAIRQFQYPKDVALDLLAFEPLIHQPVELKFDHRGRLWVVQYNQYPFPAGLKITGYDYHLRAQFDKIPDPPPDGERGADKITLLEDTNNDGIFDKATDAITGLNIATSVTWGRGKIWVLNPPYLLAFPDPEGDGFPDGNPEVHLYGFGLEDTHAVANSLRWGPDGWLYGAQGSTTTATINSAVTREVHFKGQAIWRYHPETGIFEIFAEGGGNTFYVEIDDKGRIYSGHNGAEARGQYYKQGAYYSKNWGKHGALTNPYAFGFFQHMTLEGDKQRFTHAFLRYGGNGLPERYRDALIGINPLLNFIQISQFITEGSSFQTVDTERMLTTEDHWFRPVDIKAGPDGGIYLADWYDRRLSHIDPRDTWHRNSGRIYKIRKKDANEAFQGDLSTFSTEALILLLAHPNRWHRQQALRQLGDRKDADALPKLTSLLFENEGQLALEALWALNLSGGFSDQIARQALRHSNPFVRMWTIRLLGDKRMVANDIAKQLFTLAKEESHPEVRSQLACTAKRLPAASALPIAQALAAREEDHNDPHNPLLIWWALEDKAESDREEVVALFEDAEFWQHTIVQNTILERLIQRYIMPGGKENYQSATKLLKLAPSAPLAKPLLAGLYEGLRGKEIKDLPSGLADRVKNLQAQLGENPLVLELHTGNPQAIEQAIVKISDPGTGRMERLLYIRTFGEIHQPQVIPVLLKIAESNNSSPALRQAALQSLRRYQDQTIGEKVAGWYPDRLRADPDVRAAALDLFVSRAAWARPLLNKIEVSRQIAREDIPVQLIRQMELLEDPELNASIKNIWPELAPTPSDKKEKQIAQLTRLIKTGKGDPQKGKLLFQNRCGSCHKLFGEGGNIGPDLTGYERSNLNYLLLHTIDPNVDIREGFVNYYVKTRDGRSLTGLISNRSGNAIRLRSFSGEEIRVENDQITVQKALAISLMPEGLLDNLTEQQVKDLFSFLMYNPS